MSIGSPRTICIIGAGAAGLVALKTILDTDEFKAGLWKPIVFESRHNVGGVWLPAEPIDDPPLTPLYDSLTTNLPHPVMAFTSYSFPPSTPVFPRAHYVQRYLESFSTHFGLEPYIRLNTSVKVAVYADSKWIITISSEETMEFDSVIICNGHYNKPHYPDTSGLSDWLERKKASHSAWYRRPSNLGSTVLVVGAGPSGSDISAEMCGSAETVILSVTGAKTEDTENLKRRGRVLQFNDDNSVIFEDGSMEHVDYCILATGYEMSFPFLHEDTLLLDLPPPVPPMPQDLYNSKHNVFPLARHIFPLQSQYPPSSLTFIGLPIRVAPFPLMEAQAEAVVHSYRTPFNFKVEVEQIIRRYSLLRQESDSAVSIAHRWHVFNDSNDQFDYRDEMYRIAGRDEKMVPHWQREAYEEKAVLRKVWEDLERSGEAESWVRNVGKNGDDEWIDLLHRLLEKGRRQEET